MDEIQIVKSLIIDALTECSDFSLLDLIYKLLSI